MYSASHDNLICAHTNSASLASRKLPDVIQLATCRKLQHQSITWLCCLLQIGFFNIVGVPLFKAMADLFEDCQPMLDGVLANLHHWEASASKAHALPSLSHDLLARCLSHAVLCCAMLCCAVLCCAALGFGQTADLALLAGSCAAAILPRKLQSFG